MARRRKKKNKISGGNTMTEKHGEWKKGDVVWYKNHRGEWKYGTIMYFSENKENGKTWVTYWDMTDPQYESGSIDDISQEAPTKNLNKKILRKIARSNIRNMKK